MAVITEKHLQLAKQLGACNERRTAYKAGMDISRVRFSDLVWIVDRLGKYASHFSFEVASDQIVFGKLSDEFMSDSGSGDGYGYGSDYGDGSGDGYGYGYGSGSGDGYGYGSGSGDGSGSGSGDGYGYGYGYGSDYGSG